MNLYLSIENATEKDDITVISEAVTKVNTMLLEKAKESPDYTGMGTTLLLLRLKMKCFVLQMSVTAGCML